MVSRRWTWLTVLAVLFAGLTNAHSRVHYCFDGHEPAASVRLVDGANDAPCHDGDECDYVDVDVPSEVAATSCGHDLVAIVPLLAWSVRFEAPIGAALVAADTAPPAPDPHYSRPPSRAPPR